MFDVPQLQIFYQLTLAVILGGLIGLEREYRRKEAGLRTYALVSLGSALFTIIGIEVFKSFAGVAGVSFDPSRVIQAVAIGIRNIFAQRENRIGSCGISGTGHLFACRIQRCHGRSATIAEQLSLLRGHEESPGSGNQRGGIALDDCRPGDASGLVPAGGICRIDHVAVTTVDPRACLDIDRERALDAAGR